MTAELAGQEIELAATFKAASEVMHKVVDPIFAAREIAVTAMLEAKGVEREPKFRFDVESIATVIYIGAKAADEEVKQERIQDLVFGAGFFAAAAVARDYINLLCIPQT
ncbi:hypothetical protein, partial [Rhodovulum viride]